MVCSRTGCPTGTGKVWIKQEICESNSILDYPGPTTPDDSYPIQGATTDSSSSSSCLAVASAFCRAHRTGA